MGASVQEITWPDTLPVRRKATRPMLSGVDLFHESWRLATSMFPAGVQKLEMEIRRPLYQRPLLKWAKGSAPTDEAQAIFWFQANHQAWTLSLCPGTEDPKEVYEFDENELLGQMSQRSDRVYFAKIAGVSNIQLYATASKVLLSKPYGRLLGEKLLLFRMVIEQYDEGSDRAGVSVWVSDPRPARYKRTHIERDGQPIGHLAWGIEGEA